MRQVGLGIGFSALVAVDVAGGGLLALLVAIALDHGWTVAWIVVAVVGLLWTATVVLTIQVAGRIWPSFGRRFARPS
jgi:Kef-type K+ transport system membrane component KefB